MRASVSFIGANSNSSIYDLCNLIYKYGINSIEITPTKSLCLDLNLNICSIQSILYKKYDSSIFSNMDYVNSTIEDLKPVYDIVDKYNIDNIVFGSPKIRNISNYELPTIFFNEISKKYKSISIEPNSRAYGTNFCTNFLDTLEFIKTLNCENIFINLDLGTAYLNNENLLELLNYDNVSYINHVHISAPNLKSISNVDSQYYIDIIKKLNYLGYNKFYSLEQLDILESDVLKFLTIIDKGEH